LKVNKFKQGPSGALFFIMKIEDHIVTHIVLKLEKIKTQINDKKLTEASSEISALISNIEKVEVNGCGCKEEN